MKKSNIASQILEISRKKGVIRSRDLDEFGIPRIYITRLCQSGQLIRLSRGLYRAA